MLSLIIREVNNNRQGYLKLLVPQNQFNDIIYAPTPQGCDPKLEKKYMIFLDMNFLLHRNIKVL